MKKEKKLKEELSQILNQNSDIDKLDDMVQSVYRDLNTVYSEMKKLDEQYVLVKENVVLGFDRVKSVL